MDGRILSTEELQKCNDVIDFINHGQETRIPKLKSTTEEVIMDLKGWWKLLNARAAQERAQTQKLEIKEHIEKRCAMIESDQKKMLRSLLNKPWKSIKLDHLFDKEGQDMKLITEEKEVLKRAMEYFQNQFQKKKTNWIQ